jgi:hypothetical protein
MATTTERVADCKARRLLLNIKLRDMGGRLGVSASTVKRWEDLPLTVRSADLDRYEDALRDAMAKR